MNEELPKLLADSSHMLRMYMVSAVTVLFVRHIAESSVVPAPRGHQYKMFKLVEQILVQSLTETEAVSGRCLAFNPKAAHSTTEKFLILF